MFDYQLLIEKLEMSQVLYPEDSRQVIELKDIQGTTRAFAYQAKDALWMHWPGLAAFRFDRHSHRVIATVENNLSEDLIKDLFWRNVLPFVLQAQGWEAIHASAIKSPQGIMAFCAASGTGKSTIAFGFHQRGYPLWSDDSLIFRTSLEDIFVYPLQFSLRLLPDARLHFGLDRGRQEHLPGKHAYHQPVAIDAPDKLAKVFILERISEPTEQPISRITRCSIIDSFQYLLKNAFCFSLHQKSEKRKLVSNYLDLAKNVPVFLVQLTPGLDDLEEKLDQIEMHFDI